MHHHRLPRVSYIPRVSRSLVLHMTAEDQTNGIVIGLWHERSSCSPHPYRRVDDNDLSVLSSLTIPGRRRQ